MMRRLTKTVAKLFDDTARGSLRSDVLHNTITRMRASFVRTLTGTSTFTATRQERRTSFADTIFALSSAPGRAGVAVVRVSGPRARDVLRLIPPGKSIFTLTHREAHHATFACPETGETLDRGILLWFDGKIGSFTGDDVAELHIHGSVAVVRGILSALSRLRCPVNCDDDKLVMRHAEPGEFTRRAFHNGKLDLAQAEGLADLLNAETDAQRRQALRVTGGELSRMYERWRRSLLGAAAHCEAILDFGQDRSNAEKIFAAVVPAVDEICRTMERFFSHSVSHGEMVRNGVRVVLLGAPNVGKSSLLNSLAGRNAAIVSDVPGTTRDSVEVSVELGGYKVIFSDTAGLRSTRNHIEFEGIKRSEELAKAADLTVLVLDASNEGTESQDSELPAWMRRVGRAQAKTHLTVMNKADLVRDGLKFDSKGDAIWVSCLTKEGMDGLESALQNAVVRHLDLFRNVNGEAITRLRHRRCLEQCVSHLRRFINLASIFSPSPALKSKGSAFSFPDCFDAVGEVHELAAEELRLAVRALGHVTGRFDVEELLDVVFADFCCGK